MLYQLSNMEKYFLPPVKKQENDIDKQAYIITMACKSQKYEKNSGKQKQKIKIYIAKTKIETCEWL